MSIAYVPVNSCTGKPSWETGAVFLKIYHSQGKSTRAEIHNEDWGVQDGGYIWEKYELVRTIKQNPEGFLEKIENDKRLNDETVKMLKALAGHAQS